MELASGSISEGAGIIFLNMLSLRLEMVRAFDFGKILGVVRLLCKRHFQNSIVLLEIRML